jgi:5-methylcytosine-specific restriction endonuclease McrA
MDRVTTHLLKDQPTPKAGKLLDAARHYPCAHCNRNDGTIVAAHCNELALGRGMGFKTKDFQVAYLCMECHDHHEGRRGNLTRDERRVLWYRAHAVTIAWLFRDRRIVVA